MGIVGRVFRENLGIKIAAIVLSLLVFFYVRTQKEGELTFKVSVELKGIPDSLTWTGEVPDQVSVTLSGKLRNVIKLGSVHCAYQLTFHRRDQVVFNACFLLRTFRFPKVQTSP